MCHAEQNWTEALLLVLLGIRASFKDDLMASVAELVYGNPLRILDELLTSTAHPVDPALLITELRQHMGCLRSVPASRYASTATFVHSDLRKCTHVFLRQDKTRCNLEPPYSGPYRILSRREKTLQLLVRGRPVTVSDDRVKPAYMLSGADRGSSSLNQQPTRPRPYHHLPHRQCPPYALRARAATSISLLASTSEQPSPRDGGDVGAFHSATGAIESALKYVSPDTH
jgi:hypothetical protein